MSIMEKQMSIPDMQSYYNTLKLGDYEVSPIRTDDLSRVKLITTRDCGFANIIPSTWTLDGYGDPTDPRRQTRLSDLSELEPIMLRKKLRATDYYLGFGQYNPKTRCLTSTDPKDATHLELNCFFTFFNHKCDFHEKIYFDGQVVCYEYDEPNNGMHDLQQRYIIQLPDDEWAWKYRLEYSIKQSQELLDQQSKFAEYRESMEADKERVKFLDKIGWFKLLNCDFQMNEYHYLVTYTMAGNTCCTKLEKKFHYTKDDTIALFDWLNQECVR